MRVHMRERSEGRGKYTDRVNALAARKTTSEAQEIAWLELIGHLAAVACGAGDAGHVTRAVHRQLEETIQTAETKMGFTA